MRRSRQLVAECAVVSSVLMALMLGGSITTAIVPSSFASLFNPATVAKQSDLGSLALYYNSTLAALGRGEFANASFLLQTFHFANIPSWVNQTALAANADLAGVNATVPVAVADLGLAQGALQAKEYLNASTWVGAGCAKADAASRDLADFQGARTSHLQALSVPTGLYAGGAVLAESRVQQVEGSCAQLESALPRPDDQLSISSAQTSIETGGSVALNGTLTLDGAGGGAQEALFYANGTYFGSLLANSSGALRGTLDIPFLYKTVAVIQAVVAPNSTAGFGGAVSNSLDFRVLFDQTSLALADPASYLPTQGFTVAGNLTTRSGVALPGAPVRVSFQGESLTTTTDGEGEFEANLTVPANATDGTQYVYASFAPQGVFGPSSNFTSIVVARIPLSITLSAPFSIAGMPTLLTGSATADGKAVAGAAVHLATPWGSYDAVTNGYGDFTLAVAVSPLDFGLSGRIHAGADPAQPYIAPGGASVSLHFFNLLTLVFPAFAIVTVGYEADKMRAFEPKARRPKGDSATLAEGGGTAGSWKLTPLYEGALALAAARFGLEFGPGETIREILDRVLAQGPPDGKEEFSRILLTVEDSIYAPRFEPSRLEAAERDLDALRRLWG